MAASRRVQSARSSSTLRALKSASTWASASVVRLLYWQVTHQAAVKSTKTGRPCAWASATRAVDQGCQGALASAVTALAWAPSRSAGTSQASAAASSAMPSVPSTRRAPVLWPGVPSAQAAKASTTRLPSSAAAPSMPTCWPSTHTSQTTVPNIGNAISPLNVTIHGPGRGKARATAGKALAAR